VKRVIEVLILPALLLAAIALPIPLMADSLPDPIATHWGLDGRPDGSADPTALWLSVTGVWLVLWGVLAIRARKGGRMPEAVLVLALGGFLAALMAITVAANDGAATWREAGEVGLPEVLLAVGGGLLLGGVAVLLERGRGRDDAAGAPGAATIGLGAGEHAVWVGHASSPGMALGGSLAALGLAAGGLFADGAAGWILIVSAVVVALALTWLSIVRVTASERGVRIAFGPFGVPSKHMPLDRIERAEATEIEPLRWGGWGYRWAGPGRSAVVVRRGPGLVLDLRDGRRFAVTVDEPEPAAGLLNDLRRRDAAG
jgi:uncharacterized membrane protein